MSLSARFEAMEAKRTYSKPVGTVMSEAAVERRDVMESRRRVGRQTQLDARRHNMANAKPAMRAAQAKVVAPRFQQQPPQRQRPYQGQQRLANQQSRGRGRTFQGSSNRAALKTGGMPPRGNSTVKTGSRGPGVGKAASSGDAGGRGNNAGRGRGRGRGRGGGRGGGPGGRSSGKTDGRGAGFKKPEKEEDLDQGLDEYWFKAGKGPDPKVASLDRSLDSYWNQAKGSSTATDDKMETDATGGPPSAPVLGDDPEL